MTTANCHFCATHQKKKFYNFVRATFALSANSAIFNEPSHSRLNNCAMKKVIITEKKTPHISRVKLWVKLLQYCSLSCLVEHHKRKIGNVIWLWFELITLSVSPLINYINPCTAGTQSYINNNDGNLLERKIFFIWHREKGKKKKPRQDWWKGGSEKGIKNRQQVKFFDSSRNTYQ